MILNELKDKLLELDNNVFYGMVDQAFNESVWDYIVFARSKMVFNQNKSGCSYYFKVTIVREEFVPQGFELAVKEKVCEIPGVRVSGDPTFEYYPKPNTNVVLELLTIEFVLPAKG